MDLLGRTCSTERMNAARIAARGFVIVGGIIWFLMLFAAATAARYANLTYGFEEVVRAGIGAWAPFLVTVGVFVLSLFYERLAAVTLLVAAALTIVWGVVSGWSEAGIWATVLVVVVAPLVISAALFFLAANTQRACELEEGK
jgi:hypothetical protein